MIVELRAKGMLALPKDVLKELKLSNGDSLELKVVDGVIQLTPVIVCPKTTVKELNDKLSQLKKTVGKEKSESFEAVDAVMVKLQEKKTGKKKQFIKKLKIKMDIIHLFLLPTILDHLRKSEEIVQFKLFAIRFNRS